MTDKSVMSMMTPDQIAAMHQPKAWENPKRPMGFPLGATTFQMTGHFHQVMGLGTPGRPIIPSVSQRYLRASLILEEFLELLEAMGFRLTVGDFQKSPHGGHWVPSDVGIEHIEGSRYDVVETADALADLDVVVNGSGVEFGIPMHFIAYEVYCSNLSKLDNEGNPIINTCQAVSDSQPDGCEAAFRGDPCEHLPKPDAPIGKRLKGPNYIPPNIPNVLVTYENQEI